jgi:hypothetical protein
MQSPLCLEAAARLCFFCALDERELYSSPAHGSASITGAIANQVAGFCVRD